MEIIDGNDGVLAAGIAVAATMQLFGCTPETLLRKASVAHVDRRLRRYYLIVRLLPNVFALACRSLGSI